MGTSHMGIVERLDDYGKPAWIATMVLAFILFWPAGLAVLAYLIGSGRMTAWRMEHRPFGRWYGPCGGRRAGRGFQHSSGNSAFDDYRTETLRRLEDEQREFAEFLDQLRRAKDKAEFDDFMASRRPQQGPEAADSPDTAPGA